LWAAPYLVSIFSMADFAGNCAMFWKFISGVE
jgi:hypothetical protein